MAFLLTEFLSHNTFEKVKFRKSEPVHSFYSNRLRHLFYFFYKFAEFFYCSRFAAQTI